MRKSLLAVVTAAMMSVTFVASADTVAAHMQTLAKQYQVATAATDSAEFISALTAMREASVASSAILPPSLAGKAADSEEVKTYAQGYTDMNAKIDLAIEQAKAGKMDEAKATAESIAEVRNTNHKMFR
ncbi:cytochrome b562 [Thorsellia anophelis]|uniref:Soluble cytochrome b562 n=1 Tax=Thorsellia anophelis DSM 18579 TaxID=1123402 RepID=A0A1I0FE29_9GAMM|nr:cytochrome b562 [Thorsellia anophelis]SET55781.1 soluble cytochrome b562 [Thorsellia anophelis DSM 18579]